LSVKIPDALQKYFPDSVHVHNLKITHFSDNEIWEYAITHNFAIVTKDKDFYHLANAKGHPPKIIWIIKGNCRNEEVLKILVGAKLDILKFLKNKKGMLILR